MSARVAIASAYFPAYARIPRKAQRKADEFIRKFQHDPKQPSIHYEPIGNAVDRQLRSVRVGDDYRAIIHAPLSGDIFILLYIDHHDEAYRWAEGKQLQVHPSTGTLQFFDVDEASAALSSLDTAEPLSGAEAEAEFEEKRLFSAFNDEQLFVGGVPRALLPAVRALYTEDDLDKLTPHLPREAADLLTGLAAGYEYDVVVESILEVPPPAPDPRSPALIELPGSDEDAPRPEEPIQPPSERKPRAVRSPAAQPPIDPTDIQASLGKASTQAQFRLIDESFDLDKALAYPLDAWRVYLHPSQRKIVRALTKGPMRITGGAGTGKTVVAMHRTAFLLREVFTAPDDRVLVTTFTRNLASDIKSSLEKLLEPEDLTRVEVTSVDAWAADYLKAVGHPMRPATEHHRQEAWQGAYDLFGVDGYDLNFCKTEWDAVIQAQGLTDEQGYVRAVRHHRGAPVSRADRRKLWSLFNEYRSGLASAGVAEYVDIVRAARIRLEGNGEAPRYCSVVVDEVQDFSGEALRLVRVIAGPEHANDLLLVGDAHQRIYGRPAPLSQSGINIRGRRSRELRLNYRTTAAICRWSLRTLGNAEYDDLDGGTSSTKGYVSLRKGAPPVVRHFETKADERKFVVGEVKQLLQSGLLPEEICVVARTKNSLTGGYGPAFSAAGIDFEILEQQQPRTSSVRLATMHRVKGLEYPVMFVAAVNDGLVPLATAELSSDDPLVAALADQRERCLLYVAASRARDQLFVTSYERQSPYLVGLEVAPEPKAPPRLPKPVVELPLPAASPSTVESSTAAASLAVSSDPTPLSSWPLPTRMANWLRQNGVHAVGELIALDPVALAEAKNLGRKSIADTKALIVARLGAEWVALRTGAAEASVEPEPPQSVPEDLANILERPLDSFTLPVRFFTWANQVGLVTLGDLARWRPLDVMQAENMGRTTVGAARELLEGQVGRRWEEIQRALEAGVAGPQLSVEERRAEAEEALQRRLTSEREERERLYGQGFFAVLKGLFVELETVPRMIVTRRAGLGGQAETLEEIGSTLGVTRERIRQIEKKTWERLQKTHGWVEYVDARCRELAPEGAVEFQDLEQHLWWGALADEPDALDYFCECLLDDTWRVLKMGEKRVLARAPQKDLDAVLASAKRLARNMQYPQPLSGLRDAVMQLAAQLPAGLARLIGSNVEELVSVDGEGEGARALAYGMTKTAQILAFLQKQSHAVPVAALNQALGRVGSLPDEVLILGHGLVGLERHFPDFRSWQATLTPVIIRLIQEGGPERQWSCKDLLPGVREELEVPDWLGHWHLAEALRRSEGIEYLGRLRVALPGVIEASTRIHAHVAVEKILRDAGMPLVRDQIVARLRQKLDVADLALVGVLSRPMFVRLDKERWGLMSRDLPGGVAAMSEALDELEGVLVRRQRGLSACFVQKEIIKLSAQHAEWTEEMCLSVVRGDPRFRLSISGTVGLDGWEDTRVPSRSGLVLQALEKATDRVSLQAVQERIAAIYGDAPERIHIGQIANRFGWRLDGQMLVKGA